MSIIQMADLDIDDITYLTSNDSANDTNKMRRECGPFCRNRRNCKQHHHHQSSYSCTLNQIMLAILVVSLIIFALVLSIASPFKSDHCALQAVRDTNTSTNILDSQPQQLYASDGTPFPWNSIKLPSFIKPVHYGKSGS